MRYRDFHDGGFERSVLCMLSCELQVRLGPFHELLDAGDGTRRSEIPCFATEVFDPFNAALEPLPGRLANLRAHRGAQHFTGAHDAEHSFIGPMRRERLLRPAEHFSGMFQGFANLRIGGFAVLVDDLVCPFEETVCFRCQQIELRRRGRIRAR